MNNAAEMFQPLQGDDPTHVAGYRLAARLGAGGMGRVYLSHTQGGRPVAIKVVRPELADDPAFRRRFRREITAARRVKGAYTAEVIDAEADGVPPWLATLYVPGPSLAEAVARRGPLPVAAVLWLMAGVAEALQAIHGAGIVHRDLKPSNVLLAADGPRVIDFGISLASGITSHTATGDAVGTPQYMAPEQVSVGEVTTATDVFALGQTVAFAALGEPLYGDGPSVSVMYRIVHSKPDLSRLPEQLRPLIAGCLAARPEDRVTPEHIVMSCRQLLGQDAGAGPAVWQEVTGPPAPVPSPVPATAPTQLHTRPSLAWPEPPRPAERRGRRRRSALITAAATAVAVLLTALAWTTVDPVDRIFREAAAAPKAGPTVSAQSPESSSGTSRASGTGGTGGAADREVPAGGRTPEVPPSSPTPPKPPRAAAYPGLDLDAHNSLGIKDPGAHKGRKSDIRLVCGQSDCSLESDTSVMTVMYGDPGATLDECRLFTRGHKHPPVPLAAVATGSEICVRHSSGEIALLVVQVKSTAMPSLGFLMVDLTVWPTA